MDKECKKAILPRILYWTISTLIVITLFFVLFGLLPMFLEEAKLNTMSVYGFIISAVGSIILLIAIYKPSFLTKRFLGKNKGETFPSNPRAITVFYGLIGLLLLIGGTIYSFTGNSTYLVLTFFIPLFLLYILTRIRKSKE